MTEQIELSHYVLTPSLVCHELLGAELEKKPEAHHCG